MDTRTIPDSMHAPDARVRSASRPSRRLGFDAPALAIAILLGITVPAGEGLAQSAGDMAAYQRKLDAYTQARRAFDQNAAAYWTSISDKRRTRFAKRRRGEPVVLDDYVLTHPPVYTGPSRPVDPSATPDERPRRTIPVVADFLEAASRHYGFAPERPRSEMEFKKAYARHAVAAGITRDQAVRIYGFESGGNGTYDTQAGLEHKRPGSRAISTALGYNQLLTTNAVSILADKGDRFVRTLKAQAAASPTAARQKLERKIAVLERMTEVARSVPLKWSEHEKLGATPPGLGMHALVLDVDVGPLLQTQKLVDSIVFARTKGWTRPLSAAELEMMNLTGDGNGFDIVSMPAALREVVPTSNFFQRGGYERNPVASRNNTVAKLIAATDARMDREVNLPGAKELASAFAGAIVARSD